MQKKEKEGSSFARAQKPQQWQEEEEAEKIRPSSFFKTLLCRMLSMEEKGWREKETKSFLHSHGTKISAPCTKDAAAAAAAIQGCSW